MPRVWAPEVPSGPNPLADMDSSLKFASPVITRYSLMLQLCGLLHQLTPGTHLYSWVDSLAQGNTNSTKVTPNPQPFDQKADVLTTQLYTHAHVHSTHTHTTQAQYTLHTYTSPCGMCIIATVTPDITSPNSDGCLYSHSHLRIGRRTNRNSFHSLRLNGGMM